MNAEQIQELDARVMPASESLATMVDDDLAARLRDVNARETAAWRAVRSREDWERFRDERIDRLRDSLGDMRRLVTVDVTASIELDGVVIRKLVYRGAWPVTANLYLPARLPESMPGILIAHSHHMPKTQGELQDMGMTWARQGCAVLVPDLFGHGERRLNPFGGREDYRHRYMLGMQLHAAGSSLMSVLVRDLLCGVDVLLGDPRIDSERIILLGAVAGGGDPAAVAAALDARIKCCVPFNFGGPQPETVHPLPDDAELAFNYAGTGSWESTRNLRLSATQGFHPWVIVGSIAPRKLIYAHEFIWDADRDPVWKRLQEIYRFYDAEDNIDAVWGRGAVTGRKGPDHTHCNQIGPPHRAPMYPILERWLDMPVPEEYSNRQPEDELHAVPDGLGVSISDVAIPVKSFASHLRPGIARLLGGVELDGEADEVHREIQTSNGCTIERIAIRSEREITVPMLLLIPESAISRSVSVVVAVAQCGKAELLAARGNEIVGLLDAGIAVCLPDVRGTGESASEGDSRFRYGKGIAHSSTERMLGGTALGARLRDLRAVLSWLRARDDLDGIGLWGDSLSPANDPDGELFVPDGPAQPNWAEPLGGLIALLAALFDPDVKAIYTRGALADYASMLNQPFCLVPDDVVVPNILTVDDLREITEAIAPAPLRQDESVDARNTLMGGPADERDPVSWMAEQLRAGGV